MSDVMKFSLLLGSYYDNLQKDIVTQSLKELEGASTIKDMGKVLLYTKIIIFWSKRLKIIVKCSLNWIFFHGVFYGCARYLNIENQDEIFKNYH